MLQQKFEIWYEKIGKKLLYILIGIVGIYLFFKYLAGSIAPFIIAWILASMLNPIVTFLEKRLKLARGIGTLLSMVTILTAFLGLLAFLLRQLWEQIVGFSMAFPTYKSEVVKVMQGLEERLYAITNGIPIPEAFTSIDSLIGQVLDALGNFFGGLASMVTKLPNGLFFFIVMLIGVFFMTKDNHEIKSFIKVQMPESVLEKMMLMQSGLKGALGGYVKTQLILMCFSFTICLVGLSLLRQKYALLMSFGIALFDAFPMFGSGAILIPWALYNLLLGRYGVGIGLLCVYGLIVVMRQITEPRVLSSQIGVYALVTVMAMYIGYKSPLGVLGLIAGPIIVVMIQTLQRIGILPSFKQPPKEKK